MAGKEAFKKKAELLILERKREQRRVMRATSNPLDSFEEKSEFSRVFSHWAIWQPKKCLRAHWIHMIHF